MTKAIKLFERNCNIRGSRLGTACPRPPVETAPREAAPAGAALPEARRSRLHAAAKLPRRRASPFSESAVESAALRETQFQRDIHHASIRMAQVADGQIAP